MLGHFDDRAVAAVAPRVVSAPGDTILAAYEEAFSPLDLGGAPSLVAPGRRVSYVPTAALIVRVAAVDAVGGFDPALRYGEDVDLIWRLASAGHTVRYDPSVVVQHRPRSSWGAWFRPRRSYGSAAAPLARRPGDALATRRAVSSSSIRARPGGELEALNSIGSPPVATASSRGGPGLV